MKRITTVTQRVTSPAITTMNPLRFVDLPEGVEALKQFYIDESAAGILEPDQLGALRRYIEAVETTGGITAAVRTLPVRRIEEETESQASEVESAYQAELAKISLLSEENYDSYVEGYNSNTYFDLVEAVGAPEGLDNLKQFYSERSADVSPAQAGALRRHIEAVEFNDGARTTAQTLPFRDTSTDDEAASLGEIDISDISSSGQYEDALQEISGWAEGDYNDYVASYQSSSYGSSLSTLISLPTELDELRSYYVDEAEVLTGTQLGALRRHIEAVETNGESAIAANLRTLPTLDTATENSEDDTPTSLQQEYQQRLQSISQFSQEDYDSYTSSYQNPGYYQQELAALDFSEDSSAESLQHYYIDNADVLTPAQKGAFAPLHRSSEYQ